MCCAFCSCEQDSAARRESRGEDKRPGWLGVRGGAEEPPRGCFTSHRGSFCGGLLCRASLLVVLHQKLVNLNWGLPHFGWDVTGRPERGSELVVLRGCRCSVETRAALSLRGGAEPPGQ